MTKKLLASFALLSIAVLVLVGYGKFAAPSADASVAAASDTAGLEMLKGGSEKKKEGSDKKETIAHEEKKDSSDKKKIESIAQCDQCEKSHDHDDGDDDDDHDHDEKKTTVA